MEKKIFIRCSESELFKIRDTLVELKCNLPWKEDSRAIYCKLTDYIHRLDVYMVSNTDVKVNVTKWVVDDKLEVLNDE